MSRILSEILHHPLFRPLVFALLVVLAANRLWLTPAPAVLTVTALQGEVAAALTSAEANADHAVEYNGKNMRFEFPSGSPMRLAVRGTSPNAAILIECGTRRSAVRLSERPQIIPVQASFTAAPASSAMKLLFAVCAVVLSAMLICRHPGLFPAASGVAAAAAAAALLFGNRYFCRDWDMASLVMLNIFAFFLGGRAWYRYQAFAAMLRTPAQIAGATLPTLAGMFSMGFSAYFPSPAINRFDLSAIGAVGVLAGLALLAVLNSFDLWQSRRPVESRRSDIGFGVGLFGLVALASGIYWLIFYPGIMSPDSFDQWSQAHGWTAWYDVHPVVHSFLFFRLPSLLWDSPGAVVLVQILGTAGIFTAWGRYFIRRGWDRKVIFAGIALFAVLPFNGVLAVSLWKDQPFTMALLWLMLELALFTEGKSGNFAFARLLLAAVLAGLLRQNGILVFAAVLLYLLIVNLRHRQYRFAVAALLLGILVFGVKNPLYHHWGIKTNPPATAFVSAFHDLEGIAYYSTPGAPLPQGYYLYAAGPSIFLKTLREFPEQYDDNPLRFASAYLNTALRHPLLAARLRLTRANQLWDFAMPERCYSFRSGFCVDTNSQGLRSAFPGAAATAGKIIAGYGYDSCKLIDILFWRGAFGGWLGILVLGYWIGKKEWRRMVILIPLFGNMLSLLIGVHTQEYRYYYFMQILGFFLIFCAGSQFSTSSDASPRR